MQAEIPVGYDRQVYEYIVKQGVEANVPKEQMEAELRSLNICERKHINKSFRESMRTLGVKFR